MLSNVFSWLYLTVFPQLGDFFGKLGAIAMTDYINGFYFVFGGASFTPVEYVNIFTGVKGLLEIGFSIPSFIGDILAGLTDIIFTLLGVLPSDTPFCMALLVLFFVNGIIISLAKFIINIIK